MSNHEESLDPQDWDAMKALGHRMVDDMMDYFANLREHPVWQPTPNEVKADLQLPLPHHPQGADSTYADFQRDVLPYVMGNPHPRFWLAFGASYNSGLPFEIDGPLNVNFIAQQYGSAILDRVNFDRGRIRPSTG